jgi:hypothetical protein
MARTALRMRRGGARVACRPAVFKTVHSVSEGFGIDTAFKRISAAGMPLVLRGPLVTPNASPDKGWRWQVGGVYLPGGDA